MTIKSFAARAARGVLERFPAGARARQARDTFRGLTQLKRNQAMLARRLSELEASLVNSHSVPDEPTDPRFPEGIRSRVCTQAQLRESWYALWCAALGNEPRPHRKLWEHTYIAHALDSLDMLQPGRRGIGFGVGREPLVALFAGRGCEIVATDLAAGASEARAWSNTHQHGNLDDLMRPDLCSPAQFRKLVKGRAVDMRHVPADLTGFDFCWSACSLEHLGSLEAGMHFVEQSLSTLVPGGIAIHTTECNLGSDGQTVSSGPTVLYRSSDLEGLAKRLEAAGHQVAALDLDMGGEVLDEYVDLPPYMEVPPYDTRPHLRMLFGKFPTTSVALVIRAHGDESNSEFSNSGVR